jgi:hypothetical protein
MMCFMYIPGVQCNIFLDIIMLKLGFSFYFDGPKLHGLLFNKVFYIWTSISFKQLLYTRFG